MTEPATECGDGLTITSVAPSDSETRDALTRIATAAFPTPQHYLVDLTDHVFAAHRDGEVVGGTILKLVDGENGPVGIVSWLFTDPAAQASGVGTALLDEAIEYLRNEGCRAAIAAVQWSNTPSSKIFARRGFTRSSSIELLRRFGLKQATALWTKSYHFTNVSALLWARPLTDDGGESEGAPESTTRAPAVDVMAEDHTGEQSRLRTATAATTTVVFHALLLALVVGGPAVYTWGASVLVAGAVAGGLVALRTCLYFAATLFDDRRWGYWSWGNVYPFAGVIALIGGFLPIPGHVSPSQRDWGYRSALSVLGPAAAAWGLVVVGGLLALAGFGTHLEANHRQSVRTALVIFLVLDLWFIVWPFDGYNGRVLYDWHRGVWGVLAVAGVVATGLVYL